VLIVLNQLYIIPLCLRVIIVMAAPMTRASCNKTEAPDIVQFREELWTLIKDEIAKSLTSETMTKVMPTLVKDALKDELAAIVKPIPDTVQSLSKENVDLRLTNDNMKKDINYLMLKTNVNEQYSRKYNIRIGGIKEDPEEDCYEKVSTFFQCKLGLTIENSEYDRIHRVGKRGSKVRQMIVKLKSYQTKAEVIKHRRKLKGAAGLFINEDLTAYNLDLYYEARGASFIAATWSSAGKVFVKLPDETTHLVRCKEDIQKLIRNGSG
jgi:flagellar basal body-associated protein FliL